MAITPYHIHCLAVEKLHHQKQCHFMQLMTKRFLAGKLVNLLCPWPGLHFPRLYMYRTACYAHRYGDNDPQRWNSQGLCVSTSVQYTSNNGLRLMPNSVPVIAQASGMTSLSFPEPN